MKKVYMTPLMEEFPMKACGAIMVMSEGGPDPMRRRDPIP
jgi:hypothetical protein